MRSINLIPRRAVNLKDWETRLKERYSKVWLAHSSILAANEGHEEDVFNELVVEIGNHHVDVLDRPTIIREYEAEEVQALQRIVKEPQQFFAVDYTDDELLRGVLAVLLDHEGREAIVVEDDHGEFSLLETFL